MTVECIERIEAFEGVRDAFESVYERDPYRTVFVSWPWLRGYFASMGRRWSVLALRDGERYIAFCPLVVSGGEIGAIRISRELALGAYPTADYSGLLIGAEEDAALEAFARSIDAMAWDTFRANNLRDPRVARLVSLLGCGNDVTQEPPNACRFVSLPSTWSEYVAQHRNGKPALRYVLRRREAWHHASFVEADDATIDRDIEALLQLHHLRWRSNLRKARRTYGRLFREAYARGCCRVAVLWSGEKQPLAAQAAFVDSERRAWGVYMLAYDRSAPQHSPGIGMLALGLEHAIDQGFGEYDFLRGEEPYKAQFGARSRWLENFVVRRRSLRSRVANRLWALALRTKAFLRRVLLGKTL